ncbi:ABC transporter substrate-binding protein [Shewanella atlantica]|uniref:ABC transporter substrate-binding protein n=1 Tax=Shewanella atlantica TaxID=271099 RepID=UPI003736469A
MRFLLLLMILCPVEAMAASILIIESYHREYQWDKNYNEGIISILGTEHDYHHSYLDTKRVPQSMFASRAESAWEAYKKLKPDLVVLGDDNAIKLLNERFKKSHTPVVFLGLNTNPRTYDIHNHKNFTGVLERPLFKRSLLLANQLLIAKAEKKFLVIFDNSKTSIASLEQISPSLDSITMGRVSLDFVLTSNFSSWKTNISGAKDAGYDAIFVGLYHTVHDESGEHLPAEEVISWTQKNASLPHFGFWEFTIGAEKNIGGYVLDAYLHGQHAGRLMKNILEGASPGSLPLVSDRKGMYLFSKSGIERWKIDLPDKISKSAKWVD